MKRIALLAVLVAVPLVLAVILVGRKKPAGPCRRDVEARLAPHLRAIRAAVEAVVNSPEGTLAYALEPSPKQEFRVVGGKLGSEGLASFTGQLAAIEPDARQPAAIVTFFCGEVTNIQYSKVKASSVSASGRAVFLDNEPFYRISCAFEQRVLTTLTVYAEGVPKGIFDFDAQGKVQYVYGKFGMAGGFREGFEVSVREGGKRWFVCTAARADEGGAQVTVNMADAAGLHVLVKEAGRPGQYIFHKNGRMDE